MGAHYTWQNTVTPAPDKLTWFSSMAQYTCPVFPLIAQVTSHLHDNVDPLVIVLTSK